jgi:hypothetical protein
VSCQWEILIDPEANLSGPRRLCGEPTVANVTWPSMSNAERHRLQLCRLHRDHVERFGADVLGIEEGP